MKAAVPVFTLFSEPGRAAQTRADFCRWRMRDGFRVPQATAAILAAGKLTFDGPSELKAAHAD